MSSEQWQPVIASLMAAAIAIAGWLYSRKIGVRQAEQQLAEAHRGTISALESRVRVLEDNRNDCEDRLKRTERALDEWNERLGEIWIRDYGEPT
jgi:chromosome segregation ATPase